MVDPGPSWLPPQASALHKALIEAHLVFLNSIGGCFGGKAYLNDAMMQVAISTSCSPKAPRASYGGSTIHPTCPILGGES